MQFLVAGICSCFDEEGVFHLDPGPLLKGKAKATFDFVFENLEGRVVASHTTGSYTESQLQTAISSCRNGSIKIFDFFKEVISKKLKK